MENKLASSSTDEAMVVGTPHDQQPGERNESKKHAPLVPSMEAMFCGQVLEETVVVGSEGTTYTSETHGIALEVPPGAVPVGQTTTLSIGVMLFGPFHFPEATRRSVSPIVWLSTCPPVTLLKPAILSIPHFLHAAGRTATEMGVVCSRAPHVVTNGAVVFDKEEIEAHLEDKCGVVRLDHLIGYVCLTRPHPSPIADLEVLCLYSIEDHTNQKIMLLVTYSLPTCRKHVETQFEGSKITLIGTFQLGAGNVIAIDHERQQDGWLFPLKKGKLICKDDIDYQKYHDRLDALERNKRERLYPPNFLIGAVRISTDAKPTVLHITVSVPGSVRFSVDIAVPLTEGEADRK